MLIVILHHLEQQTLSGIGNYTQRMLRYTEVRGNKRECLALTGLTHKEFKLLLRAFSQVYARQYEGGLT